MYSKHLDKVALFAALSLFLSIVELVIPKPIPFFRIGLANLPLLIALTLFPSRDFIILILLKIFGQGIVSGTLFSYVFLFSAVGSGASGIVMLLCRKIYPQKISLVGIGIMGALASNCVQLWFAYVFIFGRSTWLIAPLFLLVGTISGALLGALAGYLLHHSRWLKSMPIHTPDESPAPTEGQNITSPISSSPTITDISPLFRLISGVLMIPPFILQEDLLFKLLQIVLFIAASLHLGKRVRLLPGIIITAAVTGAQLLTPLGEVITYIGSFPVTAGALHQGVQRALNLVGLVYLSRYAISADLPIPGRVGALMYRVFYYFEELTSYRINKNRNAGFKQNIKEALLGIDSYLLQLAEPSSKHNFVNSGVAEEGRDNRYLHKVFLVLYACAHWALFVFA